MSAMTRHSARRRLVDAFDLALELFPGVAMVMGGLIMVVGGMPH